MKDMGVSFFKPWVGCNVFVYCACDKHRNGHVLCAFIESKLEAWMEEEFLGPSIIGVSHLNFKDSFKELQNSLFFSLFT
jgi:hypothetical protein